MHLTTITMVHYYLKCVRSQLASVHVHWKSHKHTHTHKHTQNQAHILYQLTLAVVVVHH